MTNYVDLSIYNSLGQKVVNLISKKQAAGTYEVEWNAAEFASGIYFFKIQAGEFVDMKKMILLR
jgi:flagellar hook assembly protein FlgD